MKIEQLVIARIPGAEGLPDLESACEKILSEWAVYDRAFCFALHEVLINAITANQGCNLLEAILCVHLRLSSGQLEAEIPDDGPGMPADWQERYLGKDMSALLNAERGRGLLFIQELGIAMESVRDQAGRHSMILKARIRGNG